jgi:SAM-dependent methyltransferase
VGAGTGKFTALLVPTGATIIAVEPIETMRATLTADLPTVTALHGTAEALPLAASSANAIVAAQAFHWFDVPVALGEFQRVLRPAGRLGVIWNERDTTVDWARELDEIVEPFRRGAPHPRSHRDFDLGDLFGPPVLADFDHVQRLDFKGLRDRVASMSFIAVLADDERAKVLDRVAALAASHPAMVGRKVFAIPYRTFALWAERAA